MKQSEYNNSINSNQLTSKCLIFLILAMVTGPLTALPVLAICKSWKNSIFLSYVVSIITVVITAFINLLVRSFGDSIVFMFEIIFLIIGYTIYLITAGIVVLKKQTKKVLIGALIAVIVSFAAALILLVIKSVRFDNMLDVVIYICKYINPVLCICTLLSLNSRCSKCGFINRGGAKFCGGCGNHL